MPKTKKKTTKKVVKKKAAPKSAKNKVVKKAVKSTTKKKAVKSSTQKKVSSQKKTTSTKKKVAKKPVAKAKSTAKKTSKKVASKAVSKPAKKASVKKPAKKTTEAAPAKAAPQKKSIKKPQKVIETLKTNMTDVEIKTKIEPQVATPAMAATLSPTIKEDKKLDTTMDELDFEPIASSKDEDYMDDQQLEHFRKILIRWKHQLMSEVDSTMGHMQEDGLSFPDPIDRASQEEGFNLELRTRDRERKLIKKIESALDMIETRDYGFCEDCGAEIGVRRLEARPTATKCIDCKTYAEIREKQAGG